MVLVLLLKCADLNFRLIMGFPQYIFIYFYLTTMTIVFLVLIIGNSNYIISVLIKTCLYYGILVPNSKV